MALNGKVMVTGGAGYIGSHAVLALCDAGYDVVVVDNLVTGFAWAVDPRATLVEANVADDIAVRAAIRDHNVRAIMHFAGSIIVPESVSDPLKYYRNNTAATRSLIESAVTESVPHFIFSSTAATYGTPVKVPIEETDPTAPINPYGMSKLMTEAMLRDVAAAHPMNYCCLRYFNVAGADPQGRSGQSTVGATHLIKIAVEAATGKRAAVSVFGTDFDTPDGTGVRDYIHVSDLAAAHVAALELLVAEPTQSHTLNAGYNRGFSVNEVLDAVDRVTNMTIERRYEGRRAGDPAALVADNRAILAALPWRPQRDDLDTIVKDALAWERKLSERQ
ncbi:UDP-glucose 4-epimerase GalE [Sphingomonas melonis TY]|jgi:UDP-glucose 4-epimerase|uniref:UDP-glucose 4-epimerase n=3 Tax=Sphingomonas TaxID=13687 RepID=A0A175XZL1_9SPHN|nr:MULTISPECIES: UDP-glucose 4-epimerase GalE [Sphingomonas]ATI56342.1 UDP-glucose 4-epimerase GalE [Sphingomonas melonis]KZB93655.1 UDP-glucose 4-epimerase GalE [Sphingomonas melonis TY]MBI0529846.1 UDP-glucose 4-epimerase GalE [Sphingomonas sp. TX0522]MBX8845988.1 UDP-glucose 4-epimerase GalE [Sphingomonas melonis]MBX8854998.1 UDP-glucose 4-epimerase GalE [Sphingomonas melonis]